MKQAGFLNTYPREGASPFLSFYDARVTAPEEVETHSVKVEPVFTMAAFVGLLMSAEFRATVHAVVKTGGAEVEHAHIKAALTATAVALVNDLYLTEPAAAAAVADNAPQIGEHAEAARPAPQNGSPEAA